MKLAIIGYSGSGKSTLAQKLSEHYSIPKLHLDTLQFWPGWIESDRSWMINQVLKFLKQNDSWIIDGNYSQCFYEERMAQADQIIFMNFSRWNCLYQAFKRYLTNRGKVRDSMASGCPEKFDWEFIRWILWDGRKQKTQEQYNKIRHIYPQKFIELSNQKELKDYIQELE
ncbi:DNA topology modulation protein flar-related protein [Streptococcus gordonii]|uniref:DNA topology modulation protein flar-related protein n=1 Tax=Streptococcus gordonii TaxID=1302 RepID=A0A139N9Y1_STRGN|nr:DNA topology modulation protein flar-related protein [Streptococcus gordonii]